jgi:hypothetical protein
MKQKISSPSFGFLCGVAVALSTLALRPVAGAPSAVPEKKPETPPTYTVARGALKAKAQLDAVVEAVEMLPVKLEPKLWSDLTVLEAVPHGARVKKAICSSGSTPRSSRIRSTISKQTGLRQP